MVECTSINFTDQSDVTAFIKRFDEFGQSTTLCMEDYRSFRGLWRIIVISVLLLYNRVFNVSYQLLLN